MTGSATSHGRFMFTISAGRTGTAWLANFLTANLDARAIHEPTEIDDFGSRMPDIRLMRTFNERGNTELVQSFWNRKLDDISRLDRYAETNHTLAKCGLIENLLRHDIGDQTSVIILRRDFRAQCKSYIARHDFSNWSIYWQWYLDPTYANSIIPFGLFKDMNLMAMPFWYTFEMEARQIYYKRLFSDRINFIEADLLELNSSEVASRLLQSIGIYGQPKFPPPSNEGGLALSQEMSAFVDRVFSEAAIDVEAHVARFVDSGRRLDRTAENAIA